MNSSNSNEYQKSSSIMLYKRSKSKMIYPLKDYIHLNYECQELVQEAEENPEKMFFISQCLLEGINGFPQNTQLAISYLKKSVDGGFIEAVTFYSNMLMKGNMVPQDLQQAMVLLEKYSKECNGDIFFLLGKINKKMKDYTKSKNISRKHQNWVILNLCMNQVKCFSKVLDVVNLKKKL